MSDSRRVEAAAKALLTVWPDASEDVARGAALAALAAADAAQDQEPDEFSEIATRFVESMRPPADAASGDREDNATRVRRAEFHTTDWPEPPAASPGEDEPEDGASYVLWLCDHCDDQAEGEPGTTCEVCLGGTIRSVRVVRQAERDRLRAREEALREALEDIAERTRERDRFREDSERIATRASDTALELMQAEAREAALREERDRLHKLLLTFADVATDEEMDRYGFARKADLEALREAGWAVVEMNKRIGIEGEIGDVEDFEEAIAALDTALGAGAPSNQDPDEIRRRLSPTLDETGWFPGPANDRPNPREGGR